MRNYVSFVKILEYNNRDTMNFKQRSDMLIMAGLKHGPKFSHTSPIE